MYAPDPVFISHDFTPSEYDIKLLRSVGKLSKKYGTASNARIIKKHGAHAVEELSTLRSHGYVSSPDDPAPWKSYIDDDWSLTNRGLICLDNAAIIEWKFRKGIVIGILTGWLTEFLALLSIGLLQLPPQ